MGGIDEIVLFLQNYKFEKEHIDYLRGEMPHIIESFWQWFASIDLKEIKVTAIPAGSIVFADEPMLVLEGPLALL